jgi:hypothetical protein
MNFMKNLLLFAGLALGAASPCWATSQAQALSPTTSVTFPDASPPKLKHYSDGAGTAWASQQPQQALFALSYRLPWWMQKLLSVSGPNPIIDTDKVHDTIVSKLENGEAIGGYKITDVDVDDASDINDFHSLEVTGFATNAVGERKQCLGHIVHLNDSLYAWGACFNPQDTPPDEVTSFIESLKTTESFKDDGTPEGDLQEKLGRALLCLLVAALVLLIAVIVVLVRLIRHLFRRKPQTTS